MESVEIDQDRFKTTGEYRWACDNKNTKGNSGEPLHSNNVNSVEVQTEDYGCNNGCTSMHIDCHVNVNVNKYLIKEEFGLEFKEEMASDEDEIDRSDEYVETEPSTVTPGNNENTINTTTNQEAVADDTDSINSSGHFHFQTNLNVNEAFEESPTTDEDGITKRADMQNQRHTIRRSPNTSVNQLDRLNRCIRQNEDEELRISSTPQICYTTEKPYKCNKYCDMAFRRQDILERHERSCTAIRPYKCTYCDKAFTRSNNRYTHERIHTGVKPYKCTQCNKSFRLKNELQKHERIHTGVKPYKCKHCNKAFTQQSYLKIHERIHTGFKPYECTYCDKTFTSSSNLNSHERFIHTGVKRPYKCSHCTKAFTQPSNLKIHERFHTGVKPYQCKHCNKTFSQRVHLNSHERVHTR